MGKAQDVIDAPLDQPALLDQVGFIIAKQCRADGLRFRHGWRGCNTEIEEMLGELTRESRELDCSVSAGLHLSRQSLGQIRRQRTWGNALSVHDTPEASDACPVIPDRPGAVVVVGEALDE